MTEKFQPDFQPVTEGTVPEESLPRDVDVLVRGTSIAALAAALDCATVGLKVRVFMPSRADLIPVGARSDETGSLAKLAAELDLSTPSPHFPDIRLRALSGRRESLPVEHVYGIPASPLASGVTKLIGSGGAFRAYLDRVKPVLTLGKEQYLDDLVGSRMGQKVLTVMVAPLVEHAFGAHPDRVEVAVAMPGLNEGITRAGSLSGSALDVLERYRALTQEFLPSSGWESFVSALLSKLVFFGAEIRETGLRTVRPETATKLTGWVGFDDEGVEHRGRALIDTESGVAAPSGERDGLVDRAALPSDRGALRTHARSGIHSGGVSTRQEVFLISSGALAGWTLAVTGDDHSRSWEFASPQHDASAEAPSASTFAEAGAELATALPGISAPGPASWQVRTVRAPALGTAEGHELHQAYSQLVVDEETLLRVGEGFSFGSVSGAVEHARGLATPLRRRLTGIA